MSNFVWPSEDGWPYPDTEAEQADLSADVDDDALLLRAAPPHLFDRLEPVERLVITAHYGLDGSPPQTMREIHIHTGMSRAELRQVLSGGLSKLRTQFNS